MGWDDSVQIESPFQSEKWHWSHLMRDYVVSMYFVSMYFFCVDVIWQLHFLKWDIICTQVKNLLGMELEYVLNCLKNVEWLIHEIKRYHSSEASPSFFFLLGGMQITSTAYNGGCLFMKLWWSSLLMNLQ